MKKNNFLTLLVLFLLTLNLSFAGTFNNGGDFLVNVDSQKSSVLNNDIKSSFIFNVENTKDSNQEFFVDVIPQDGWDIVIPEETFILKSGESKEVEIKFLANSDFDFSPNLVSKDTIKLSQRENYAGNFEFPVTINGLDEKVSIKYEIDIMPIKKEPLNFVSQFSKDGLSPVSDLRYSINAQNIESNVDAEILIELGQKVIGTSNLVFSKEQNYKIGQVQIPEDFEPGNYNAKLTLRISTNDGTSAQEWYESSVVEVVEFEKIDTEFLDSHSIFQDLFSIKLKNIGNIDSTYTYKIDPSFFKSIFLGSNVKYDNVNGEKVFNIEIKKGEEKTLYYYYNYVPLYFVLIIIIFVIIYIYYRKNSNPLSNENKLYDIHRVNHEGVKYMKIRIGFENVKENEIDDIKIIFRMPSYLNVKENSFLLSEPNHVLKGKSQYKLVWDFKRFEKTESRILGFGLENKKGILGDIKLPDLEFELKINGKVKKHYVPFNTIKG